MRTLFGTALRRPPGPPPQKKRQGNLEKRWPEALETKIPEEGETGGKGNGVVSPTQKSRRGRNHFPFRLDVRREPNSSSSHKEIHFVAGSRRRQAVRILGKVKEVKRMMGRGTEREIKEVVQRREDRIVWESCGCCSCISDWRDWCSGMVGSQRA